jgi:hypothetical protein
MLIRIPIHFRPRNPDHFRAQRCEPTFRLRESPRSIVLLRCACQGIARPCCPLRSTLTVLTSQIAALRISRSRPSSLRLSLQWEQSASRICATVSDELYSAGSCHQVVTWNPRASSLGNRSSIHLRYRGVLKIRRFKSDNGKHLRCALNTAILRRRAATNFVPRKGRI